MQIPGVVAGTSKGFGELLRRQRLAAGFSQQQLAEQAGLSAHGISDLERGARTRLYAHTVQRLAVALGLSNADRTALHDAARGMSSRSSPLRHSTQAATECPEPTGPNHNLAAPHRQLFGREQDAATVRGLTLQAPGRLVTLTGTGGCGKTQLALLVATSLIDAFPDGVWFVDLAPVQAGHMVSYAVVSALGHRERGDEALLDTLIQYLSTRAHCSLSSITANMSSRRAPTWQSRFSAVVLECGSWRPVARYYALRARRPGAFHRSRPRIRLPSSRSTNC